MNRALLRKASVCARNILHSPPASSSTLIRNIPPLLSLRSNIRFFSSENDSSSPKSEAKPVFPDVEDVSNKDFKVAIEKYFDGDKEVLPDVMEAVIRRKMSGKHEESDEELIEELESMPDIKEEDFDNALEGGTDSDEEYGGDLYNARDMVMEKMVKNEFFNMNDNKYADLVQEAVDHEFLTDTKECEQILHDMLNWEKIVPEGTKKKVEKRFNEIAEMVERGEVEVEEGYELFKEFEDKMIFELSEKMAAEAPQFDEEVKPDNNKDLDDPPGEGPILRWQTRCVFAPGDDAWHPKNRKVKMGVTVKELGLSKHQFRRLRELVGKRYNPGKDELMITSERFEHREENRKDCLRTLFALIEEAGKANKLVKDAVAAYMKENGEANPKVMARLNAKQQV